MFLIRALVILVLMASIQGCVTSNGVLDDADDNTPYVNYLPVGIPLLVGGHGTSVPITEEVSITAKHVAELDYSEVIAYHPYCDLALIKQDNTGKPLPTLGIIFAYQPVTTVGKNMFGKTLVGKGRYYRDIYLIDHELFSHCPASLADAPVQSGMSGGGVYNSNAELVGIISAKAYEVQLTDGSMVETDRISIFVPLLYAREWLITELDGFYVHSAVRATLFSSAFFTEVIPLN
ncbi:serine protease [Vibrio sp. 404]|uniref:Serine protease n=1 Tax=Vibrio marinisediminis TaxID=2758441 RepID=A0A7W2IVN6_9VIBR|nr:serine protease [Vibrio marinisediminis]MBA5764573.1 serine protease [Vibrio marinisediminis]